MTSVTYSVDDTYFNRMGSVKLAQTTTANGVRAESCDVVVNPQANLVLNSCLENTTPFGNVVSVSIDDAGTTTGNIYQTWQQTDDPFSVPATALGHAAHTGARYRFGGSGFAKPDRIPVRSFLLPSGGSCTKQHIFGDPFPAVGTYYPGGLSPEISHWTWSEPEGEHPAIYDIGCQKDLITVLIQLKPKPGSLNGSAYQTDTTSGVYANNYSKPDGGVQPRIDGGEVAPDDWVDGEWVTYYFEWDVDPLTLQLTKRTTGAGIFTIGTTGTLSTAHGTVNISIQ